MAKALLFVVSALLVVGFAAANSEPHKPEVTKTKPVDEEAKKAVGAPAHRRTCRLGFKDIRVKAKVSSDTVLTPVSYAKEKDFYGVVYPDYIVKIRLGAGSAERYIQARIYHGIFDGKYYLRESRTLAEMIQLHTFPKRSFTLQNIG